MGISSWPRDEQPRERLLSQGAAALTDAELVALCLRSGVRGKSAVELGRELITRFDGLSGLLGAHHEQLRAIKGMGDAKAAQLAAVLEMSRRSLGQEIRRQAALTSPSAVRDYLRLGLSRLEHEVFVGLFLDSQHRVLESRELFRGTLTQTSVYPREVVKAALRANAAAAIFAHNHPSGVAQPSQADEMLTRGLREALALVDIRVLDHFIVAGNQVLSFAERGLL